jgi:hypothetical protein
MSGSGPRLDPEALEQVSVDALDILPGATFIERDDWVQLSTPSSSVAPHNQVLRARLDESQVDATIARLRDEHVARGASLRWTVGPGSSPANLSERLTAAGIPLLASATGMVRPVTTDIPDPAPGITLRAAVAADADDLGDLVARGWERPASFGDAMRAWFLRNVASGSNDVVDWLGELDGELVGACTLRLLPTVSYMQGGSVLPHARGRGVYQAMIWKRIALTAERGLSHTVIWASDATSGPTARKMGFEPICGSRIHQLTTTPG